MGFPHSEISGSKVAGHLPEAYRRQTASFIAFFSQGIHHTPLLRILERNSENRVIWFSHIALSHDMLLVRYKTDKTFLLRLLSQTDKNTFFPALIRAKTSPNQCV